MRGSRRRDRPPGARLAIVAVAVAAVLAGAAVALAAHRAIARGQAQAVAASIDLRHGDLPAYAQDPNPVTSEERRTSAQLSSCVGTAPAAVEYAKAQSPKFTSPGNLPISVSSTAQIQPSQGQVAKDLAAVRGPRAVGCLKTELGSELRASLGKGQSLISVSGAALPSVVSGGDGAFAYRFVLVLGVKQGKSTVKVPVFGDFIGFAWGQAEASLSVETELTPPPAALERRLSVLLVSRARAAIG